MTPASATDDAQNDWQLYNFTPPSFFVYEAEIVSSACATGTNQTDCTVNVWLNTHYCGPYNVILSETFQSRFLVFHSLIYPFCLLVVLLLYSVIYRAVLVQRARRQSMRSVAVRLTLPPTLDNTAPGILPFTAFYYRSHTTPWVITISVATGGGRQRGSYPQPPWTRSWDSRNSEKCELWTHSWGRVR